MSPQLRTKISQEVSLIAAQISLDLFESQGYENTTVDEVAQAAGMSRRTFFRHFGSKEDIIFTDHEFLLQDISAFLSSSAMDPWENVILSAQNVFEHFVSFLNFAKKRFRVVRSVPELRARETVMVVRYQSVYYEYLCSTLPKELHLKALMFVSAMVSAHNQIFRAVLRDEIRLDDGFKDLEDALLQASQFFQVGKYAPLVTKHSTQFNEMNELKDDSLDPLKVNLSIQPACPNVLAEQLREIANQIEASSPTQDQKA